MKVYKFCAFCAPSCQTIGAGPVSRASLVGFNAVIPFLLALKRYGAFGREELLVYNSVHFIVLEKLSEKVSGEVLGMSVLLGSLLRKLVL